MKHTHDNFDPTRPYIPLTLHKDLKPVPQRWFNRQDFCFAVFLGSVVFAVVVIIASGKWPAWGVK